VFHLLAAVDIMLLGTLSETKMIKIAIRESLERMLMMISRTTNGLNTTMTISVNIVCYHS